MVDEEYISERNATIEGLKNLKNDIDKDNHLFIGTINPKMLEIAINEMEKAKKIYDECEGTIDFDDAESVHDMLYEVKWILEH